MNLSPRVLACVRGPLLAALTTGCASAAAAAPVEPIAAEPAVAEVVALGAITQTEAPGRDPVGYDASTEANRLARSDARNVEDESRRDRRLGAQRLADRRAAAIGSSPTGPTPHFDFPRYCGRG